MEADAWPRPPEPGASPPGAASPPWGAPSPAWGASGPGSPFLRAASDAGPGRSVSPSVRPASPGGDAQTQLEPQVRIMRADMASLRKALQGLEQEVLCLKQGQQAARADVDREREDRNKASMDLCNKIVALEQDRVGALEARFQEHSTQHVAALQQLKAISGSLVERLSKNPQTEASRPDAEMQQRVGRLESLLDQLRSDHAEHREHMSASHTDTLSQLTSAKDRTADKTTNQAYNSGTHNYNIALSSMKDRIVEDAELRDRRATLLERQLGEVRGEVEKNCGLSSQMIRQTVMRLEEVQNRLLACEAHGANLQEVREVCTELPKWKESLEQRIGQLNADLRARLTELSATYQKYAQEQKQDGAAVFETLRSANEKLNDHISKDQKARDLYHTSVQERLQHLEGIIAQSASTHAEVVDATHAELEGIHARFAALEATACAKAPVEHLQAQLRQLEFALAGVRDKHTQDLEALRDASLQIQESPAGSGLDAERLAELERRLEEAHGSHRGLTEEMRNSRDTHHLGGRSSPSSPRSRCRTTPSSIPSRSRSSATR
ncbi:unnamed protein product [Prorocentrum cordatum]|uniref:Centrosomal protein of 162 kDa n=1 Tax=Prorocentrum cordatum TaxID=2364126 RepID=A0ABN9U117_9DINO|nr:unnamed protein product [Polarella glacialis]